MDYWMRPATAKVTSVKFSAGKPSALRHPNADLFATPVVTYRHLLSEASFSAAAASNPLRVVVLCDIDAAYTQFEAVRLGLDSSLPIGVLQWNGLIAVNAAAKSFGIKRHETPWDVRPAFLSLAKYHLVNDHCRLAPNVPILPSCTSRPLSMAKQIMRITRSQSIKPTR